VMKKHFRRSPSIGSIGSNHSGGPLALCDVSAVEATGGAGSSSCMEVDHMESNLAAIQSLVQAKW
jgi:hypothetical protein